MSMLKRGCVGIMPAGALGVAFFHHLTDGGRRDLDKVSFIQRSASDSGREMFSSKVLHLCWKDERREIVAPEIWGGTLMEQYERGALPEVLLVCTLPDQVLAVIGELVRIFERLHNQHGTAQAADELPYVVLCSNGIYFQRVRQFFLEKLEEGTLLGRLPDLWPDLMPRLVSKLLRGVTIQTGQRQGAGSDAIYRPGPRGRTRVAGGDAAGRSRCLQVLTELGGWFEIADGLSPTRVEFDKALINLIMNLLGQLCAVGSDGEYRPLTVGEILHGESEEEARELARRVLETGKAVHAYPSDQPFEVIWSEVIESCNQYLDHVPSSLQWIGMQLNSGKLQSHLTPTERWLLEPLIRYAHAAGLEDAAHYFEALTRRVETKLLLAIGYAANKRKKGGTA